MPRNYNKQRLLLVNNNKFEAMFVFVNNNKFKAIYISMILIDLVSKV